VRAHRLRPAVDPAARTFQDPVWSIAQPSPQLEQRAAHLLSHLHRVRVVGALRERVRGPLAALRGAL
jgi:hypothetical protein